MSNKDNFVVQVPIECLSDIDSLKNKYVYKEWDCIKLKSRGKIIKYIINEWKRLESESAQSISKDEFTVCQEHIDMMYKGHVC